MYSAIIANLEERVKILEKDYGRLCQNDSVMRIELSAVIKRLEEQEKEIKELKPIITKNNLTEELYNQLGIHTDKLEPKSATKIADEEWHKWAGFEEVEDGYYRQVDKVLKEVEDETLSSSGESSSKTT